jgi:hypothetical protein
MPIDSVKSETEARRELATFASDFLKAIALKAKNELGPRIERKQRSQWMVNTGPNSKKSVYFERNTTNSRLIDLTYQMKWTKDDFPEQRRLGEALSAKGILDQDQQDSYFLALLHNWLQSPEPLAFDEPDFPCLLDEFSDSVLNNTSILKSRSAIIGFECIDLPVFLEKGIFIRPITEEELWDLGDIDKKGERLSGFFDIPGKDWNIVEIKFQFNRKEKYARPEDILNIVLIALRLVYSKSFIFINLGYVINFDRFVQVLGSGNFKQLFRTCFNTSKKDLIMHLKDSWPIIHKIMESEDHYLRLPAQRLLDGGFRERPEDAILDYAIGLERLLTAGERDELSYRFALRGAMILTWDGGNKSSIFDNLKKFYELRSSIVHGARDKKLKLSLSDACSIGEDYLRKVWWWYFENGFIDPKKGLEEGTELIDSYILSNRVSDVLP